MKHLILVCLFLFGCGGHHTSHLSVATNDTLRLHVKYDTYSILSASAQGPDGFIEWQDCDSLLFSALLGSDRHLTVNLLAARDPAGYWNRRPVYLPQCYPQYSGSRVSIDHLLGVMWYAYANKRLDIVEQLWDFGVTHSFTFGDGSLDRTVMAPTYIATLADIIVSLGGTNHKLERLVPQVFAPGLVGYQRHIQVLHALLRGTVNGHIDDNALDLLRYSVSVQPNNALYQYALHHFTDGDQTAATQILLRTDLFPEGRLPKASDRCEQWLWQRDEGDSWAPCDRPDHSGADLIFVANLIFGGVK